jgi:hypothetical protein
VVARPEALSLIRATGGERVDFSKNRHQFPLNVIRLRAEFGSSSQQYA